MSKLEIQNLSELAQYVGKEIAVTPWVEVTQERINRFAEVSGDKQWMHTDVARATAESPYGTTVAQGFLTLSLLSPWLVNAVSIKGMKANINYGADRIRFPAPVRSGESIRARLTLTSIKETAQGVQLGWHVIVESAHSKKPVCVADLLSLPQFE